MHDSKNKKVDVTIVEENIIIIEGEKWHKHNLELEIIKKLELIYYFPHPVYIPNLLGIILLLAGIQEKSFFSYAVFFLQKSHPRLNPSCEKY